MPHPLTPRTKQKLYHDSGLKDLVREEVQKLKDELLHTLTATTQKGNHSLGQPAACEYKPLADAEALDLNQNADKQADSDFRLNPGNEMGTQEADFGTEVRSRFEKLEQLCTEHAKKIEEVFSKLDEVRQAWGITGATSCDKLEGNITTAMSGSRSEAEEDAAVNEVVEQIARKDVGAARTWRLDVGHWFVNAAVDGQSMVDQMCKKDMSLPASAAQKQQFENARKYHTEFISGAPMGMFLCAWCVLIFFFLIWDEVQKSMIRVLTVLHLERAAKSRIVPIDGEFVISTFSSARLVGNLLLCVLRVGVACIFLYSGSLWLVFTEDAESLILNAVALVFVLDIDELVYQIACPSSIKALLETIKPLDKPSVGSLHVPLRAIGTICGSICVLTLFGTLRLRPFAAEIRDLRDAFCGGNTNFVAGANPATGIVYAYTKHQAPHANRNNLLRLVVSELRDNSYQPNHITSATFQDFKADVASSLAGNVGRFGVQCADIQPGTRGSAQSDEALLAAMKGSIGSSAQTVTSCSQLTFGQCTMDPAIIRLACPVTCGCSLAFEGNFRTSGCPIAFCSALQSFLDGLYIQPIHDIDTEVLQILPAWNRYWQSVLNYTPTYADSGTWSKWELRGLSKQVLVHRFQSFGCGAFAYFRHFYPSEYNAIFDYFCDEQNLDTRRPLAIFCPHACDCKTRIQRGASTFCPREPPVNSSIYVPSHCPGLHVRNATMLDNSQCKQDFSNRTGFSHPGGWYNCSPNAYNGKHVYSFTDSSQVRWEIRWESAARYDWGAYFLGQRVGLGRTSKWTLSSIDPQFAVWARKFRSRVGRFFNNYSTALPSDHGWFPRTSSNTDFDCASGDMTLQGTTAYLLQSKDRNYCPIGYGTIFPAHVCQAAAAAIGIPYRSSNNVKNYPIGCFVSHDSGNSYSVWHNTHRTGKAFPTCQPLCEKLVGVSHPPTIPCDFENGMCGWTTSGPYRWFRMSGATPSNITGPDFAQSGSYYMVVEASAPNNPMQGPFVLESPTLPQHSPGSNRTLSFYYHMYGVSVGQTLRVTALGSSSPLWGRAGNHGNSWQPAQVYVPLTATKIRFEATTGWTWQSDIAIDTIAFA